METTRVDGVKRTTGRRARTLQLDVVFIQSFDQVVWRDYYVNFSVLMSGQLQNSNTPKLLDLLQLLLDFTFLLLDLDLCGISAF